MGLQVYHKKRKFNVTPEPRGRQARAKGNQFVIQKHAATRLHYDLRLELDGVILTKFDSDTRGGAILSVKSIVHKPIKFIGVGEKLDRLEEFHPDRMASRILGGGDMMSLVEKVAHAQTEADLELARKQQERMAKGEFTLDDFRASMGQMKKLGSV